MKRLSITLLLVILGCGACQGASPVPIKDGASDKTPTEKPSPTSTAAPVKDLIEWADLRPGKGPVYSQDWSPDGHWLVTADTDQIRVWDTTTFQEAGLLEGHISFIWGLDWSPVPDKLILASASKDGSVRLWDVESYTQIAQLETGWAFSVDWSPDGKQLAVGTNAGNVQVWDIATQQLLYTWKSESQAPVISIGWSPNGKTIASGKWDGIIHLWDVETGQIRRTISDYTDKRCDVNGLDWSPDGATLATAHQDGKIRLWNTETFQLIQTLDAHRGWSRGVAWSPNGNLLASTGEDKRVCLWNVNTGHEYAEQHHNSLPVWSVSWSPDGKMLASGAGAYQEAHTGATIVWKVP